MFGGPSGNLPSVMKHDFSMVPKADIPRSQFDRSHGLKTAFYGGYLIPIYVDEALPGDTFNMNATTFGRMATPIAPIMDNLHIDTFFFAVPYRLVWDNFKKFNGEQKNPGDSTSFLIPTVSSGGAGGFTQETLPDYMGLPIKVNNLTVSSLPFRAYNLIWNEWFRDQNLQNSIDVPTGDGPDDASAYQLRKRGKRHDYFTSCLPWPQKGTAVTLPLGTVAPVIQTNTSKASILRKTVDGSAAGAGVVNTDGVGALVNTGSTVWYGLDPNGGLSADLTNATAATINSLRQAFQIQRLYERDARGGTRYTEIIRSHFGVVSPDARVQRPEYLGGGSTPLNITPVPQTSVTGATPQGNLAAYGTFSSGGNGFVKSFTEHCIIIGLVSVRGDLNYQQGIDKLWNRRTRWDFYWPALAHLGEQAVLNKEIYAQGTAQDDQVFGYQERYAEYRYKPSKITGVLRSTATGSLDFWHTAQRYSSLPVLGATFIEEAPAIDRCVAVPSQPHFIMDCYFNLKCARPMPTYSVPGMIDHF